MADGPENNTSKIGFDAKQAFDTLRKLRKEFESYSKSLNATADASEGLNKEQSETDDHLKRVATFAELAAANFKDLAKAQKSAAAASREFNGSQKAAQRKAQQKVSIESTRGLLDKLVPRDRNKANFGELSAFDRSVQNFQRTVAGTKVSAKEVEGILNNLAGTYVGASGKIRDAALKVFEANQNLGSEGLNSQLKAQLRAEKEAAAAARRAAGGGGGRKPPKTATGGLTPDDEFGRQIGVIRQQLRAEEGRKAEKALRDLARGTKDAKKEADALNLSLKSIFKIAATQIALSGFFQIVGAFRQASEEAINFELRLAEIQTISETFQRQGLSAVGDTVANISKQFALPLEDVAKGLYETLSNQIGTAAESARFLGDAATFSRASVSSLADSVDLLSSVINSYGLTSASAGDIAGKLFRTIDLGRVTADELANTIGRVLPLAAELGVSFDEVAASIATLTIQGVKANEAYTLVSNVMLKLIRPTENLREELNRLGIASAEAGIQAFGFQGLLQVVTEQSGNTASEVGELFNQVRGTRGVLGIAGKSAQQYADTLKEIQAANEEASISAANLVQATTGFQLQRELQAARATLVNEFGRTAIVVLNEFIQLMGGGENAARGLTIALGAGGLAAAAGLAVVAISKIITATKELAAATGGETAKNLEALGGAFKKGLPAIAVATAAIAIVAYLNTIKASAASVRQELAEMGEEFQKVAKVDGIGQKALIKERQATVDATTKAVQQQLFTLQRAYNSDRDQALTAQEATTDDLQNQLGKRVSLLNSFVGNLQAIQSKAENTIKDLTNKNLSLDFEVGQGNFARGLRGLSEPRQAEALVRRSLQVLAAAKEAAAKGNKELADELFGAAAQAANQAADTEVNGNANAQGAINAILRERQALNQRLIDQERQQANEAKNLEINNGRVAAEIDKRVAQLKELQLLEKSGDVSTTGIAARAAQRKKLASEIDGLFTQVSAGGLSNVIDTVSFKTQIREITAAARDPITGVATNFAGAIDSQARAVINQLQATTSQTDLLFRIKFKTLTGEEFDPIEGPRKIQEALAKAGQQFTRDNENTLNLPNLRADANTALTGIQRINEAIRSNVVRAGAVATESDQIRKGPLFDVDPNILRQTNSELAKFEILRNRISGALRTGDVGGLRAIRAEVAQATANAQAQGERNFGNLFGQTKQSQIARDQVELLKQLDAQIVAAAETVPKLQAALASQSGVNEFTTSIQGLQTATTQTFQSMQSTVNQFSMDAVKREAEAARAALQNLLNVSPGRAKGGTILGMPRFAAGGVMGPDSVNAKLSPGEFVMNPRSSRMFRSQLIAMNRGIMPRFAEGGLMGGGNTSFGDVKINISGAEAKNVNGVQLAKQLKRELRKKTIKRF